MKRLHVHIGVGDIERATSFYTALFGAAPSVRKDDYAKWRLADPPVNLAISLSAAEGVDHLGLDVDEADELAELTARLTAADEAIARQEDAHCCYARSDKTWTRDPAGTAWEAFHSRNLEDSFGGDHAPEVADAPPPVTRPRLAALAEKNADDGACCG